MATRPFNIVAALSAVAVCLVVVAWFAADGVDPRTQFLSLSPHCHLSVYASPGRTDARVYVFNDATYGPYSGSTVGISAKGVRPPEYPKVSGVGDMAGLYYRMIRQEDGASLWTLSLSLVYLLVLFAAAPALWLVRRSRRNHGSPAVGGEVAGSPAAAADRRRCVTMTREVGGVAGR